MSELLADANGVTVNTEPRSSDARVPTSKKRLLTEDRRQQNREAQRRYREKRKSKRTKALLPLPEERNDIPSGQIPAQSSLIPHFGDSLNTFFDPDFGPDPLISGFNFEDFTSSSFTTESQHMPQATSATGQREQNKNFSLPSPYVNYLQIQKLNFCAACVQNALHIGIPEKLSSIEGTNSPWYWDTVYTTMTNPNMPNMTITIAPPIARPLRPKRCFNLSYNVNSDLAPTQLQLSTPHQLYIDLIPFPIFRDRIITMLSMDPPAFDEREFKRDIENDGLLVWGTGIGSPAQVGSLVRDKRNWECSKAFFKKWKLLVSGSGLDEQSRWWRRMRGGDYSDGE